MEGSRDSRWEFDLCARCSAEAEVMRVATLKKLGLPTEGAAPLAPRSLPHVSYDFAPQPIPCLSCARILSAEDD